MNHNKVQHVGSIFDVFHVKISFTDRPQANLFQFGLFKNEENLMKEMKNILCNNCNYL